MPIYMVGPIGQGLESRGAMGTSTVRGLVTKRRRPWSVCNTNHVFNLYPSGGAAVSIGTFGRRAIARGVVHLAVAP